MSVHANNDLAVRADGLCIQYRRYRRKDITLKSAVLNLFRGTKYETFSALRDASFSIRRGESVGIIGPNGSGKSTLLKALAGILPPAGGRLEVHGKVAPLIELSGGFSQELTGRENIYLNGAIMGFSRKQMDAKIERIIEFAELGEFIDAPLSTYSSGMKGRLGFAVATDVDPEILLLDEVFAVGDASFKKKAEARTRSFFESDRTVITVSHSLQIVRELCDRAMYLRFGDVVADGEPSDVIERYLEDVEKSSEKARGSSGAGGTNHFYTSAKSWEKAGASQGVDSQPRQASARKQH